MGYYTIIYFYRGKYDKYDGLAPREKQYSPSPKGDITKRWRLFS